MKKKKMVNDMDRYISGPNGTQQGSSKGGGGSTSNSSAVEEQKYRNNKYHRCSGPQVTESIEYSGATIPRTRRTTRAVSHSN